MSEFALKTPSPRLPAGRADADRKARGGGRARLLSDGLRDTALRSDQRKVAACRASRTGTPTGVSAWSTNVWRRATSTVCRRSTSWSSTTTRLTRICSEGNSLVDQKLVTGPRVRARRLFFKNNFSFRQTDLDTGGRTVDPVKRPTGYDPVTGDGSTRWPTMARACVVAARHGTNKLEEFVDHCLSVENLIDLHAAFSGRRPKRLEEDDEPKVTEIPRLRAKDYMESFINPTEYLESQRKKIEAERDKASKFPEHAERDVLLFLLENAPLERWETRRAFEIVREEACYRSRNGRRRS